MKSLLASMAALLTTTAALLIATALFAGCNNDSVEEGSYADWTKGLVTQKVGDNTLYFVPSKDGNGMMLTFDRTDMSYERLVQMAGGSLSATEGGSGIKGLHIYVGDIEIPASVNGVPVTAIDQYAFSGNIELTSVTIPASVREIGAEAFAQCENLASVVIPEGVTEIKAGTFCGKSAVSVTIPNSVKTISHMAFLKNTRLTTINFDLANSQLQQIEASAFSGCTALKTFAMPVSVEKIGTYAFRNCSQLNNLIIESRVSQMDSLCFNGCSRLTSIHMKPTTPPIVAGSTLSISSKATIYVPKGSLSAYKEANYWSNMSKYKEE